jgi:polyhydroxyalkanoate synthesis regulator protein
VPDPKLIVVKRYGGSRLYDTAKARYVTVDELRRWKSSGIPFEVRDAESGADIARVLLA